MTIQKHSDLIAAKTTLVGLRMILSCMKKQEERLKCEYLNDPSMYNRISVVVSSLSSALYFLERADLLLETAIKYNVVLDEKKEPSDESESSGQYERNN